MRSSRFLQGARDRRTIGHRLFGEYKDTSSPETSEGHDSFLNTFECLLRILSRRRCCGHGHRFRSHRSTAYGRGGGVGRGLGVGANLGVGVGLAVAVGVALAVAVAVAVGVGVGLPPPTKLNLPTRVRQTPLWAYWLTW